MQLAQLREGEIHADAHAAAERHAHSAQPVDLGLEYLAGQAVGGNPVGQDPAGSIVGIVDGDRIAEANEVIGTRQARRPGADDADALLVKPRR